MRFHVPTVIERKRDGHELSATEIASLIEGFTRGDIPDYQVSAFAMAVFFRGMSREETSALTRSMMESGRVLHHPKDSPRVVDKHSTGGVGDKVSLILASLLACGETRVPMISGRGLGITGGTLDKLESIPGFNVHLDLPEAMRQLERLGVFMIGQTEDICPADKRLYALRDVTATVPSRPLIIASIMSKKLAENLDALVLDVKFGRGAFMKTREDAESLAEGMRQIGVEMGVETSCVLTPMEEPLGHTVGNALEVSEAVAVLKGDGPKDLIDLTLDLAAHVSPESRARLGRRLEDGTAWEKFVRLVEAQGGDVSALERLPEVHRAPVRQAVKASESGVVTGMDAERMARGCLALGAGRHKATDTVDFAVGCSDIVKVGTRVHRGEKLCTVHARTESSLETNLHFFESAVSIKTE